MTGIIRKSFTERGALCVATLTLMLSIFGQAQDTWSGQVQCQLAVQADGYAHQEIQTWTLTGGAPTQQGAMQIYPATWSVTGQGGAQRAQGSQVMAAQWSSNVPSMNAPIAIFVRASDNRLVIKLWHAQLSAFGATNSVRQVGSTQTNAAYTAYEWSFPAIDDVATSTNVSGTGTVQATGNSMPVPAANGNGLANCKWQFSKGGSSSPQNLTAPREIAMSSTPPLSMGANASSQPAAGAGTAGNASSSAGGAASATISGNFGGPVSGTAPGASAGGGALGDSSSSASVSPAGSGQQASLQNSHPMVSGAALASQVSTLPAPTGFQAHNVGNGSVQFSWQAVTGANKYRLDGPGIPSAGLYVTGTASGTSASGVAVSQTAFATGPTRGTRIQNVPLGPGTWHIATVDSHNLSNPNLTANATAIVRYVPSHSAPWLTKNNGSGSQGLALSHYLSLCPQCVPGADFGAVVQALGVPADLTAAGNIFTANPQWADSQAARYTNATEFGTTRVTKCWIAIPGVRTVCYSNSADHGLTVIVQQSDSTWFLTFASSGPMGEVLNWGGGAGVPISSNYKLTTQVTLDSEGPKYAPHACLACHGGKFNGGRVTGATLLPLDTGLLRIDDRSNAMAANFLDVNRNVAAYSPSPAVKRYVTGLYGGDPNAASGWGDLDYVPAGWKQQSDFYKAAVRPYCMMCHLATPSNLDFSTSGNFAQNKALINAEVCSGHTMPHAEYPFKQFWTQDTGNIFLPGYLAAGVGITTCQ
jgi:hypothetical protein